MCDNRCIITRYCFSTNLAVKDQKIKSYRIE